MSDNIAVVTFDGDETLWNLQGALRAALVVAADMFTAEGLCRSGRRAVTAEWLRAVRDEVAERPEFHRARMEEIRWVAFQEACTEVGASEEFAARLFGEYMEARHSAVVLFDEAEACLRELASRGFRIGLVTNGNSKPSVLGVESLFEVMVVAADCGLNKPDPAIYRHTADRFGVPPQACVHVGDHLVEDVKAAAEADMRPVWINRGGTVTPGEDDHAWHTIASLGELPPLLGKGPGRHTRERPGSVFSRSVDGA